MLSSLISHSVPPLRTSDTAEKALEWMLEFHVRHLPIVNNLSLLGILSEEDILNHPIAEDQIGALRLSLNKAYVKTDQHIFEVMKIAADFQLSIVPVVDMEGNYEGMITLEYLVQYFAKAYSMTEHGAILVLAINRQDYSMSEIARITESENISILSSFLRTIEGTATLEIILKLNATEISRLIASFERFDYTVKASYNEMNYMDDLKHNFNAFLNYMNI